MKKVVIDGDLIVYAISYVKENSNNDIDIEYLIKSKVRRIYEDINTKIGKVFISGINKEIGYRDKLATIQEYKGNRKDRGDRPIYLEEVKRCMVKLGAIEVKDSLEVDDYLGIEQSKDPDNVVICSLDKDLMMIPGHHYNWNTLEYKEVSIYEGYYNFFIQLLMGDRSDNIKGLSENRPKRGIGKKGAMNLLKPCSSYREMLDTVKYQYLDKYGDNHIYHHWNTKEKIISNAELILEENANLLWIKRHINESWNSYTPQISPID